MAPWKLSPIDTLPAAVAVLKVLFGSISMITLAWAQNIPLNSKAAIADFVKLGSPPSNHPNSPTPG
jgi:hypothetical protein